MNLEEAVGARFGGEEDVVLHAAEVKSSDFTSILHTKFALARTRLTVQDRDHAVFAVFAEVVTRNVKLAGGGHRDRSGAQATRELVEH